MLNKKTVREALMLDERYIWGIVRSRTLHWPAILAMHDELMGAALLYWVPDL